MKKRFIILPILLFTVTSFSQQIGDGYAPDVIKDFSMPLKSGIYNGYNGSFTGFIGPTNGITPDVSNPWQHLFAMRHIHSSNNYQLQIASSFAVNDRLFFRKIVGGDLSPVNTTWIELATRGVNIFTGNQTFNGNVGIGVDSPQYPFQLNGQNDTTSAFRLQIGGFSMNGQAKFSIDAPNISGGRFIVNEVGNIGIGTSTPDSKLAVNGTIHSKEVKVDMIGWSDFVFKKEYNLPTLAEVEKHINEKGHLENIPSEEEVLKNGINLGEMNAKLLQKIEELTLYMIEMKKENNEIKNRQSELENTVKELKNKSK